MTFEQARFNMVEQQIRPWDVLDAKVLDLFMSTPRHEFVTEAQQQLAYTDTALPIGEGQSMLPPTVEARMLQALDIAEDETVLEIGTGSGYNTALLAKSANQVTTVEYFPSILETAKKRLQTYDNIQFCEGDGSQDWSDGKQYDVIYLSGAVTEVSSQYLQKLTLGGRIAAFVGTCPAMTAQIITRVGENEWETETLFETVIPSLIHAEPKATFQL